MMVADPKQFSTWHMAGLDGRGGSSYIDALIVEKRDASTNWNAAADTLESDKYMCQNWRYDVIAILDGSARRIQGARFDPNGVPTGLPRTDVNGDGTVNSSDEAIILTASGGTYDVRADINLDGAVNATDQSYFTSDNGTTLGYSNFSLQADHTQGGGHRHAFTGGLISFVDEATTWRRNRALRTDLGIWTRRDPLGYVDGPNLYGYVSAPIGAMDPNGLCSTTCGEEAAQPGPKGPPVPPQAPPTQPKPIPGTGPCFVCDQSAGCQLCDGICANKKNGGHFDRRTKLICICSSNIEGFVDKALDNLNVDLPDDVVSCIKKSQKTCTLAHEMEHCSNGSSFFLTNLPIDCTEALAYHVTIDCLVATMPTCCNGLPPADKANCEKVFKAFICLECNTLKDYDEKCLVIQAANPACNDCPQPDINPDPPPPGS